jgi:peptide chain release factor 2
MRERRRLEASIGTVNQIGQEMADAIEFVELGEMEGDDETVAEGLATLAALANRADADKVQALLAGEADANNAYLEVHAGAGGTESQDWAEMLQRMYTRWAERHGYKVDLVDYHAGEAAGIKSATLLIKGENAYGYAKTESGVHRLVRISPYDSSARRHTSFSSVWVYPEIDDNIEVEINPADLKIDTYRASGAGGQHVNTTDSAVRITHVPTGIIVASQNDRSQHKNRATAMNMLKARIHERNWPSARRRLRANMPPRPRSAGATRSAPTSCNPISRSRTCARAWSAPIPPTCLTGRSIRSWRRPCRSA